MVETGATTSVIARNTSFTGYSLRFPSPELDTSEFTRGEEANHVIHNKLNFDLEVGGGGSLYPTYAPTLPYHLRPVVEQNPNFSVDFNLGDQDNPVSIVGPDQNRALAQSYGIEVLADLSLSYRGFYHNKTNGANEGPATNLFDFGIGGGVRLWPDSARVFFIDLLGHFDISDNQHQYGNRYFFNGNYPRGTAVVAVGSDFDSYNSYITGRLIPFSISGGYIDYKETPWFSTGEALLGLDFKAKSDAYKLGYEGRVDTTKIGPHLANPDLALEFYWTPKGAGSVEVPEYPERADGSTRSIEKKCEFDLEAGIAFSNLALGPFAQFAYSFYNQTGRNSMHAVNIAAGLNSEGAGLFELGINVTKNPTLYYNSFVETEDSAGNTEMDLVDRINLLDQNTGGYLTWDSPWIISIGLHINGYRFTDLANGTEDHVLIPGLYVGLDFTDIAQQVPLPKRP